MVNIKQGGTRRQKMAERSQQQLNLHFSGVAEEWIWHRSRNDGFTTIPRSLPLAMQAIDAQSKGQPAGHTLFCLWARSPDNAVITIENPATIASETGFVGNRAVDTWRKRMKKLRELWFIQTKEGPTGEFHYVLLINPNAAMQWLHENNLVQPGLYARFVDRLADIGALGELEKASSVWKKRAKANADAAAAAKKAAEEAAATEKAISAPAGKVPAPPRSKSTTKTKKIIKKTVK